MPVLHNRGSLHEAQLAEKLLVELKALADAVCPYAHVSEHVEALGPPYERARRAIAKAEGRWQTTRVTQLPPPEPEAIFEPGPRPIRYTPPPRREIGLDRLRHAAIAAQKRAGADAAIKVVMAHGGQVGGKPSLKALPPESFAACVAALEALPEWFATAP
jgi:hypothetical protein